MANEFPIEDHIDWAPVTSAAELPNVTGAAIQNARVRLGHRCVTSDTTTLYVCQDPTPGSALWVPQRSAGASRLTTVTGSEGLWLFNGSLLDSSGNARNLLTTVLAQPPYLARLGVGLYAQRAVFGGYYDENSAWNTIAPADKTIEAVIRTSANGTADQVLAFCGKNMGASADTMWAFYIGNNGNLGFYYFSAGPTARIWNSDAMVPGGKLTHVAVTMAVSGSDVTVSFYINGWPSGSHTFTSAAPLTVASSKLFVLDTPANDSPFTDNANGAEIHGLHIVSSVLTGSEIAARALAVLGPGA